MVSVIETDRSTTLIVYDNGYNAQHSNRFREETKDEAKSIVMMALTQGIGTEVISIHYSSYTAIEIKYN